ncbi:MAG TPA: hydrogenase maturation protease [Thermoplasmata archaeon]|jgi:hydrogenase maturation protease
MHKLRDTPGQAEADLRLRLEEIAGEGRVYVLGLGNTDRADDGAGILVAKALKKRFPSFSFSEHDGVEGTVLDISEKDEDAAIIFVDAADLKSPPGTIIVVRREDIKETEITTHRVAVALMAAILEKSNKRSAVVCIQPETIEFRGKVSKRVRASAQSVTGILADIMSTRDESTSD